MEKISCLNCAHKEVCREYEPLNMFLQRRWRGESIAKKGWFFEVCACNCLDYRQEEAK